MSHKRKKPVRGSEFSVSLPTEPMAGAAKTEPVMAVMVAEDGVSILEYDLTLGASIAFRVGGAVKAFMERVGPAPDSDIKMIAGSGNVEPVTVEYEHALAGPQKVTLQPGEQLSINAVVSRRWVMTAPTWE